MNTPSLPDPALAATLTPRAGPVWLRVGRGFDGHEAARDVHLVYDRSGIRHYGVSPPVAGLVRPGQAAPDAHFPEHTVLPGLIESHAHLFLEGGEEDPSRRADYLKLEPAELLRRAEARLPRLRRMGFAAVRDAGDKDGVGLALQARYRSERRGTMPYLDSPGAAIHRAKRYGRFMGRPVEDYPSIEACVAARIEEGAHRIKLIATGIIDFEHGTVRTKPQFTAAELQAAASAARAAGRQTFAHCSGHDGVEECLAAGVDSIEHGFFLDDDQLARLRDRDIAWVPTFAPVQFQVDAAPRLGWTDTVRDNLRRIVENHAVSLARAGELGVRIIAGSDAGSHGVAHGHGFLWELELMERAGLSTSAVLRSATGAPGQRLGFSEAVGELRPGKRARFLLTRADVFDSVRHLRQPMIVVYDGEVETAGDDPAVPGM